MERLHGRLAGAALHAQPRTRGSKQEKHIKQGVQHAKHARETRVADRSPDLPLGIAKVTVNTSQTQLAWARPIKKKKGSTTRSKSSSTSSLPSSVPTTPLPAYSPPPVAYSTPQLVPQVSAQQPPPQWHPAQTQPSLQPRVARQSPGVAAPISARRQDKVTPSFYSFATDSTKLGEIPMRKWTTPFNQAEADRLNAIALATGWRPPPPPATLEQQQKGGSRFMRLFRKGKGPTPAPQAVH